MPILLPRHRRSFALLSLLAAAAGGASLSASCTLDLEGQGSGGGGSTTTTMGMGGGAPMVCTPMTEKKPCYTGNAGTEGKGTCKGGQMTCNAEGTAFGPCFDQVTPTAADDCANKLDTSCDEKLTCTCTAKETVPCYDGMQGTQGVGTCLGGTRTCNDKGTGFGECLGQVKPADVDDCTTQLDENCDGAVNEMASGCMCDPAMMTPSDCTSDKLGVCAAGTHVCNADGKGYGACTPKLMPSLEDCFTPADEDCDGAASACMGTSISAAAIGTMTGDESVFGIATDAMGNIVLGGVSGSSSGSNYGVSAGAAEIIKLDKSSGTVVWQKTYPATGAGSYAVVRGVTVDGSGNVIVIGEYQGTISANSVSLTSTPGNNSDAFVIKVGADGSPKWGKSYGNGGDQFGSGISTAANGDVFLIGTMSQTMNFGATLLTSNGSTDLFVARLDGGTGDPKWGKNFGSSNTQYGWDIVATSDGNVVLTGQSQGGIDFGGGSLGTGLDKDIFLAKLDGNNGNQVWAKAFGDGADQVGYGVTVDSKGNIVLTGVVSGKTDFGGNPVDVGGNAGDLFVASFEADGKPKWSKFFGDASMQVGRDVAVDALGNVLVTGYFIGSMKFDSATTLTNTAAGNPLDVFVAKFKGSDGAFGWARSFGDAANDQVGRSIATDPSTNVILGGTFKGGIDFGAPTSALTSQNNTFDSFWAKLAP